MTLQNLFRRAMTHRHSTRRQPQSAHDLTRRFAFKPRIEYLEDRLAPALMLTVPSTSTSGQTVTMNGSGANPGDNIQIIDNLLGTVTANDAGDFSFSTCSLAVGTYPLIHAFDTNTMESTPDQMLTVMKANTNTVITASATPATGTTVTYTATVSDNSPGSMETPTGTVTFQVGASAPFAVPLVDGKANFHEFWASPTTLTITASYNGDSNFNTSTAAPLPITNSTISGQLSLSAASPGTILFGQTASLTVTATGVTSANNGDIIDVNDPTNGTVASGVLTVTGSTGTTGAMITSATIAPGTYSLTAKDITSAVNDSTGAVSLTVNPDATSVTVTRPNSVSLVSGQAQVFSATITNTSGTGQAPTGSVQFQVDGVNAGSPITLDCGTGNTTTVLSSLLSFSASTSPHTVTAVYTADGGSAPPSSVVNPPPFTVSQASTQTVITASDAHPSAGETVTYTATVSVLAPGTGSVTNGTVGFSFDSGTATNANVGAGGVATMTHVWAAGAHRRCHLQRRQQPEQLCRQHGADGQCHRRGPHPDDEAQRPRHRHLIGKIQPASHIDQRRTALRRYQLGHANHLR